MNNLAILLTDLKNLFWRHASANKQSLNNFEVQTEQKRRSAFLRTLNLVIIVLMIPATPLSDEIPIIVNGAFLLVYLIIFALNERRYSRSVAFLFCFILMLHMFYVPLARIVEGGVETVVNNSGALYLISLPILLAGALIHAQAALGFTILQSIGLFLLLNLLGGEAGLLAFSKLFPSISFWWLIGVVIWLYERSLGQAFAGLKVARENLTQLVKELEEKNSHLEEQIIERQRAEQAAEAANRAKSAFLANMSHELRTPLNAILGFTQLMSREQGISVQQEENLQIILRSGEHLLTLINDVLEMSKIEAGRTALNQECFDLYGLLEGLEEMFRLRAANKGLQLILDIAADVPQYIEADQSKLRQVLINLLSNGIKFTQEGEVSLRVAATRDSLQAKDIQLAFEIEDTGSGIAESELQTLFEPFVQTKTGQLMQEGTGLGLSISRQFLQLMGSTLTVKSEIGRGSVFKFKLPITVVEAGAVQTKPPSPRVIGLAPSQPSYRLLVVEDRLENRQLLLKLLQPLGFEVQTANNGLEALEIWQAWQPHLIWMDMRMPVMDGYEATKRIKATIQGQATVIIALTASALEEERAIVLSAGCDDFIRKPFREAELFEKMAQHLGLSYLYEEESAVDAPSDHQSQALQSPILTPVPPDLLLKLEEATIRANFDLIFKLIDQIHAHNAALADQLSTLAHDFEYDAIVKLLQEEKAA